MEDQDEQDRDAAVLLVGIVISMAAVGRSRCVASATAVRLLQMQCRDVISHQAYCACVKRSAKPKVVVAAV